MIKLELDCVKRILHLDDSFDRAAPGTDLPTSLTLGLQPFVSSGVTGLSKHNLQQLVDWCRVDLAGCPRYHALDQQSVLAQAGVHFHADVPLVT